MVMVGFLNKNAQEIIAISFYWNFVAKEMLQMQEKVIYVSLSTDDGGDDDDDDDDDDDNDDDDDDDSNYEHIMMMW